VKDFVIDVNIQTCTKYCLYRPLCGAIDIIEANISVTSSFRGSISRGDASMIECYQTEMKSDNSEAKWESKSSSVDHTAPIELLYGIGDLIQRSHHCQALVILIGQCCIARAIHYQRRHACRDRCIDFLRVVTQKQYGRSLHLKARAVSSAQAGKGHATHLQLLGDLVVAARIVLQAGICGIEPCRDGA